MPTYEYRCPNGHTFEVFQRMADPPVEACQECGAGPVEKILFPVAVHFKGSGFYSTDYGRGSRKGGKDGDGSGSEKGADSEKSTEKTEKKDASTSASGDSTPAPKTDKKNDKSGDS